MLLNNWPLVDHDVQAASQSYLSPRGELSRPEVTAAVHVHVDLHVDMQTATEATWIDVLRPTVTINTAAAATVTADVTVDVAHETAAATGTHLEVAVYASADGPSDGGLWWALDLPELTGDFT